MTDRLASAADGHASAFARRMLVLAMAAGLLVALLAPVSYAIASRAGLRSTSAALAEDIAFDVAEIASRDPYLWRYNLPKVIQATSAYRRRNEIARVDVAGCDRAVVMSSDALGFALDYPGPAATAPIRTRAGVVGFVTVSASATQARSHTLQLAGAGAFIGVLLAWGLFVLPRRVVNRQYDEIRHAAARLGEAQQELREANAELAGKVEAAVGEVRVLSARAVHVQEEERARIARDLHDTLGQHLTAQRFEIDGLGQLAQSGGSAELTSRVGRLQTLSKALLDDLRRSVRDLRPAELEGRTLTEAISDLGEAFEISSGVAVSVRMPEFDAVSELVSVTLVRIVQEALTNVGRHAHANEVGIRGELDSDTVVLTIQDDGRGGASEPDGHGLRFMRHRIEHVGGTLLVRSEPGEGTILEIRCPTGTTA